MGRLVLRGVEAYLYMAVIDGPAIRAGRVCIEDIVVDIARGSPPEDGPSKRCIVVRKYEAVMSPALFCWPNNQRLRTNGILSFYRRI